MLARMLRVVISLSALLLAVCAQSFAGEDILHSFNPKDNGGINPAGGLLMDDEGNFYGATLDGTVFEFSRDSSGGWNYSVLCNSSGTESYGSLVMDKAGNLYGSTYWGGVYKYSPASGGKWNSTLIYSFNGGAGAGPSPVILDGEGNLYGTYGAGGSHNRGFVFELSQALDGTWELAHLHDFSGTDGYVSAANDAANLLGGLSMDASGNIYGTTGMGGSSAKCSSGCGVVFELTKNGDSWNEKTLHNFVGSDGSNPDAPLLIDASGNLYGTTTAGGTKGFGVVFKLSPQAGLWGMKTIYDFTNANGDGAYPNSKLTMDSAGDLFGTTEAGGGTTNCIVMGDYGCGTVFELKADGGIYKESILERYLGEANGGFPQSVHLGQDGNLYGLALVGGGNNRGLIFEIAH